MPRLHGPITLALALAVGAGLPACGDLFHSTAGFESACQVDPQACALDGAPADSATSDGPADSSLTDVVQPPPDGGPDAMTFDGVAPDATADSAGADGGEPDASPACGPGEKLCGSGCVATTSTDTGCAGSSCAACAFANATAVCGPSGECAFGACEAGYADCDGNPANGCEVDTTTTSNCGGCGVACSGGDPDCVEGTGGVYACGSGCPASETLCSGTCANLATSSNHCGTCTTACPTLTNGSYSCESKECTPACNTGYQLCTVAGVSTCVAPPDTVHGVFVSTSSTATTGCGSIGAPCGTIAAGIAIAKAQGLTIMYLDKGTYAEQVTLLSGLTIEGGWYYKGGGVWTVQCGGGTTDPSSLAIIQPASIASGAAATVLANGVTATLSTLTVRSLATAAAGQSLYGVFASSGANLAMNAVEVSVAAGGAGTAGGTGTAPTGPQPPCGNSTGAAATTPGANGVPVSATYASTGYVPGTGKGGSAGVSGNDGIAGGAGSQATPEVCSGGSCQAGTTVYTGNPGTGGCGGAGGAPGLGGTGGGASIGVYVWGATVNVNGGALASGNGGAGGAGGAGASGEGGSPGAVGAPSTIPACEPDGMIMGQPICKIVENPDDLGGSKGGTGGAGSAGGSGASGSGGDSYAYYAPAAGSGVVKVSGTTLMCGSPGTSPGPVAGASGSNGSGTCHD